MITYIGLLKLYRKGHSRDQGLDPRSVNPNRRRGGRVPPRQPDNRYSLANEIDSAAALSRQRQAHRCR
jgi:hypothetical protein